MADKRDMSSVGGNPSAASTPYPSTPSTTGYISAGPPVYTSYTAQQPSDIVGQGPVYQSKPLNNSAPCLLYLYNGKDQPQVNFSAKQPVVPPQQTIIGRQPQLPFVDHTNTALVVTFCCCCCGLPLGIVGLLKMGKAKQLLAAGNYDAATAAATSAGKWTKAGLIIGVVFYMILVVACVLTVIVVASINRSYDYD